MRRELSETEDNVLADNLNALTDPSEPPCDETTESESTRCLYRAGSSTVLLVADSSLSPFALAKDLAELICSNAFGLICSDRCKALTSGECFTSIRHIVTRPVGDEDAVE